MGVVGVFRKMVREKKQKNVVIPFDIFLGKSLILCLILFDWLLVSRETRLLNGPRWQLVRRSGSIASTL